jgi:hypothetical protein
MHVKKVEGKDRDETKHTRAAIGNSHYPRSAISDRSLGATPAHTRRTKETRHGWYEVGDGHDDEIAASPANDGPHEEYG